MRSTASITAFDNDGSLAAIKPVITQVRPSLTERPPLATSSLSSTTLIQPSVPRTPTTLLQAQSLPTHLPNPSQTTNNPIKVDIVLDETTTLKDSHDISESLQYVLESVPGVERAWVHTDYKRINLPSHMEQM